MSTTIACMATQPELDELRKRALAIRLYLEPLLEGTTLDAVAPADWPEILNNLDMIRWQAETATKSAVKVARGAGVTWDQIAKPLRLTRQGAQKRYGLEIV